MKIPARSDLGLFTGRAGYAWDSTLLYVKGGAAGVGLEFGFTPNWSAGVEDDHMFRGRRDVTFTSTTSTVESIRQSVDMVTTRINYRWGGQVVAKF